MRTTQIANNDTASTHVQTVAAEPRHPFRHLIASLGQRIDEVLHALIPRGSICALVDFPRYGNIGDCAIWSGEKAWLRCHGIEVVYACELKAGEFKPLARRLGTKGILLLSGGGNFGDLFPDNQRRREAMITAFPSQKIIQLPQTIWFEQNTNLDRARLTFAKHQNLVVLVRDQQSLEVARRGLKVSSALCPDMAFVLGPLVRLCQPSIETLWLWRTGKESCDRTPVMSPGGKIADWADVDPWVLFRLRNFLSSHLPAHLTAWVDDLVATVRLERGYSLLSQGKVIITDRLHGHILSLLLGIPHIVLDNNYGKVKGFYDTWTRSYDLASWADSPAEAWEQAKVLIRRS